MTPDDMATCHAAAFDQSRPWSAKEFADLQANAFTFACGDSRCFALVQAIAGEAELLTIATHPTFQRQGLARQCMEIWHGEAVIRGATRAFLDVAADNPAAIALYERHGYTPCGQRRGYYQRQGADPVDAIVMERRLP
jgi:[ribosomal protein S18]-alanine N-acetyltransferase